MGKEYVKNYLSEIKEIKNSLSTIETIISKLPDSSWKFSMSVSTTNFTKKVDAFLSGKEELTDQQKDAIARIKKGEIPAFQKNMVETPKEEKKGKKH